jgi:hypothetical protein
MYLEFFTLQCGGTWRLHRTSVEISLRVFLPIRTRAEAMHYLVEVHVEYGNTAAQFARNNSTKLISKGNSKTGR